ncbi:UDP-N-acetylmuramoyl-tripeptide--D-alanyl-D-alanine ligase, partial [Campylobacter coli]
DIFKKELKIKTIILKEKADLVKVLAKETQQGDLILFSNDAPSFM